MERKKNGKIVKNLYFSPMYIFLILFPYFLWGKQLTLDEISYLFLKYYP